MTRKKKILLHNPHDVDELKAYIEASARGGKNELQILLREKTPSSHVTGLKPEVTSADFQIIKFVQKVAAATHVRGRIAEAPCSHCKNGNGPFQNCVVLNGWDGLTKMCCSNCQWTYFTTPRNGLCDFAEGRPRSVTKQVIDQRLNSTALADRAREQVAGQKPTSSQKAEPGPKQQTVHPYAISALEKTKGTHILGDLYLPFLKEQSKSLQEVVEPLLSDLEVLHRRDMTTLVKPINSLDQSFKIFEKAELKSWTDSGSEKAPPAEFLVKPSGLLSSPISHRLNQPSFTTRFPENGEVADPTNGCTAMVMYSIHDDAFMYDQVHRRDDVSHGCTKYPPFVRTAHLQWTNQISRSSLCQVLYGLMVLQKDLLESRKASESNLADLIHYRFDNGNVPLVCMSCAIDSGSISNIKAAFSINFPGHYVVSGGPKFCAACQKSRKLRSITIPTVLHRDRSALSKTSSSLAHGQRYSFLIRPSKTAKEERVPVDCHCIRCREQTKTADGKSSYIDYFPRWTHGNIRPLYVEHTIECLNCESRARGNFVRFIPVDENIPSICARVLSDLADMLKHFQISTISIFLDRQPPSSRIYRGPGKKSQETA